MSIIDKQYLGTCSVKFNKISLAQTQLNSSKTVFNWYNSYQQTVLALQFLL